MGIHVPTNKAKIYSVVLGQCTKAMKAKIESKEASGAIRDNNDVTKLLLLIRDIASHYKAKTYPFISIYNGMKTFYRHYQRNYATVDSYMESFQNIKKVIKHCGGSLGNRPLFYEYSMKES